MSCGRLTKEVQKSLAAVSTSEEAYVWFTDWIPCTGVDYAYTVMRIAALNGNFKARAVYQTATVRTNKPNGPTTDDGWEQTEGAYFHDFDLTAVTDDYFFIRFGVECLGHTSTLGSADVSLQVSYRAKGTHRGSMSKNLVALDVAANLVQQEILTGWMPAIEASKFNVAYVVSEADANFQFRFAYQTAATTIESPSSWTAVDGGTWNTTGDQEDNLNEETLSLGSNMWVRFALEYSCSSLKNMQANVSAVLMTRG